jgi:RNA recognition motif-containing protein
MNIYVGGLSPDTNEEELRETFAAFGDVASVKIVRDGATGESRGFGFVTMPSEQAGTEAVKQMNGQELKGGTLKVEVGRSRTGSPGFGGKGPGGRGGDRPRGHRPGGPGAGRGGPSRGRGPSRGGDRRY